MAEPNTPNIGLIVPNTGDLVGSWGTTALNPDFVALDGMLGGTITIPLTSNPVTLGIPAGSIAPTAGPTQSQNALIKFTGALSTNIVITLGMPGRYVFWNTCTPITNYVQVVSSGNGGFIGLPPGKKCSVFHDGTNVDFIDMPDVGTAYDLHGVTSYPAWMTACSMAPYLVKDGSIYDIATYPFLGALLGSTFGGDGVTTFAVPDERARARIAFDTGSTNRMTSPVSGTTMASAGGNQSESATLSQANLPNVTIPIPSGQGSHSHTIPSSVNQSGGVGGANTVAQQTATITDNAATLPAMVTASINGGVAQTPIALTTVQPCIVSFLPLVKT